MKKQQTESLILAQLPRDPESLIGEAVKKMGRWIQKRGPTLRRAAVQWSPALLMSVAIFRQINNNNEHYMIEVIGALWCAYMLQLLGCFVYVGTVYTVSRCLGRSPEDLTLKLTDPQVIAAAICGVLLVLFVYRVEHVQTRTLVQCVEEQEFWRGKGDTATGLVRKCLGE